MAADEINKAGGVLGRQLLLIGLRAYAQSGLLLVFGSISIGFTLTLMRKYFGVLAKDIEAGKIIFMNMQYWLCFFTTVMCFMLQMRSKQMASNFTNFNDGPGPAAAVAGLAAGAAGTAVKFVATRGANATAAAGGAAARGAGASSRSARQWLSEIQNRGKASP